jgi:hypothetical protein
MHVKRLPTRLCGRWAEKVKSKSELSTWEEFAIRWKSKRNYVKGNNDGCKRKDREGKVPGKVVVTKIQEVIDTSLESWLESCTSFQTVIDHVQFRKARSIHESGKHTLQECRKFTNISVDEEEKLTLSNRLCLSCLTPRHRLSQCQVKVKRRKESCGMPHHTLVDEVDKRFIEGAKVKKQEHGTAQSPPPPPPNEQYVGFYGETWDCGKGQALVEVLPVVGKNGGDLWSFETMDVNTTLMDEE